VANRAPITKKWTPEEYLAFDRSQPEKYEYFDGDVFLRCPSVLGMAGASPRHNRIEGNVFGQLYLLLHGRPCLPWNSNQRIRNAKRKLYAYPDVSVVCGAPTFAEEDADTITNAKVVFEVLSPSTEDIDRGIKFIGYRAMPSLAQYVLVSQTARRIELFTKDAKGEWRPDGVVSEGVVRLESLGVEIPIDEIYADVDGLPVDE
jgi:Uma2 family endonuclease